jgi:hypothetical protein
MATAIRTALLRILFRCSLGAAALACVFLEPTDAFRAILNNSGAILRALDTE